MSRLFITIMVSLLLCGFGDPAYFSNQRGNELYESGQYESALREYVNARESGAGSSKTPDNNMGATFYRLGKYAEAARAFSRAMETDDSRLRKNAGFNRGVSLFKAGEKVEGEQNTKDAAKLYEQAVKQFIASLKDDPTDNAARHNLELAMTRMTEAEKKEEEKQKKSEDQNKNKKDQTEDKESSDKKDGDEESQQANDEQKKNDKEPDQKKDKSEDDKAIEEKKQSDKNQKGDEKQTKSKRPKQMSQQEAEQIFSAIEQDEKDLRERMKALGTEETPMNEKDW